MIVSASGLVHANIIMGNIETNEGVSQGVNDKTVEEFVGQIGLHRRHIDLKAKKCVSVSLFNQTLLIQETSNQKDTGTNLSIEATIDRNGELIPTVKFGTEIPPPDSVYLLGELQISILDILSNVLAACECCRLTPTILSSTAKTNSVLIKHIARSLGFYMEHETFFTSFVFGINPARWRSPSSDEIEKKRQQIMDILLHKN